MWRISPHDNFFSTGIAPGAPDKYEVCVSERGACCASHELCRSIISDNMFAAPALVVGQGHLAFSGSGGNFTNSSSSRNQFDGVSLPCFIFTISKLSTASPEWRQTLGSLGLLCRRFAPSCSHWKRKSLCQKKIKNTTEEEHFLVRMIFLVIFFMQSRPFCLKIKSPEESEAHYLQTICKHLYI